jgi:Mg/Co/Ni transporter MgtE
MPRKIKEAKTDYSANERYQAFFRWERDYKKRVLRELTPKRAFEIFSELYDLVKIDQEILKKLRMKRIKHLMRVRKRLAKLEGASE